MDIWTKFFFLYVVKILMIKAIMILFLSQVTLSFPTLGFMYSMYPPILLALLIQSVFKCYHLYHQQIKLSSYQ